VAQGILKDWPKVLEQFIKVYPRDYRRVLEEAEAISDGKNKVGK
jgi:glutamate synthase domain-containing protein 3